MKYIRLICNPTSGRTTGVEKALKVASLLIQEGHTVSLYRTTGPGDAYNEVVRSSDGPWDLFVAIGGDGTINEVAGGILASGIQTPLAIIQEGTVNDIARYLKLRNDPSAFLDLVKRWNIQPIDLGTDGSRYFMNVAAGGMITGAAHNTPSDLKTVLGRGAYYLEILRELTQSGLRSYHLRLQFNGEVREDKFNLFIISNTPHVGGFDRIAPLAEIQDGLLDCIFIRETGSIQEAADLFWRVLWGSHTEHPNVLYVRTDRITIESLNNSTDLELDMDGELAGHLPVTIQVCKQALHLLV